MNQDIKLTTSKKTLLKRANIYFKHDENSWMCLDDFINENCPKGYVENKGWLIGVANYLQNTARYTCEIQNKTGFYEVKPSPSYKWDKQNSFWNRAKIVGLTVLLTGITTTIIGLYIIPKNNQQPMQITQQSDTLAIRLKCDIEKLQGSLKTIHDTLKAKKILP